MPPTNNTPDELFVQQTLQDLVSVLSRHETQITSLVTLPAAELLTISAFLAAAILSQRPDLESAYEWIKVASASFHANVLSSYYEANSGLSESDKNDSTLRIIVPSFPKLDLTKPNKMVN